MVINHLIAPYIALSRGTLHRVISSKFDTATESVGWSNVTGAAPETPESLTSRCFVQSAKRDAITELLEYC